MEESNGKDKNWVEGCVGGSKVRANMHVQCTCTRCLSYEPCIVERSLSISHSILPLSLIAVA